MNGSTVKRVTVGQIHIGGPDLVLIAGPCVVESAEKTLDVALRLEEICDRVGIPWIFKASYDKANRTSAGSFRGPGIREGLDILASVKMKTGVPVTSDVHTLDQVSQASGILDLLQIPAFLCRQTDLLSAAAATEKPVNVKKGQFLSPWDVKGIVGKVRGEGGLVVTERGTTFGYNNLVVDFRSFPVIRGLGVPVVYDATHSLQLPGGLGSSSGGMREYIPYLCRSAVACGVDAVFMEVHPDPDRAPCDGPNMWPLDRLEDLLRQILAVRRSLEEVS